MAEHVVESELAKLSAEVRSLSSRLGRCSAESAALREELQTLVGCLGRAGVLSKETFLSKLHRRRFEAERLRHCWQPDACLTDLLSAQGITCAIGSYAGPSSLRALLQADKGVRTALRAISPLSLDALFPTRIYACGGHASGRDAMRDVERYDLATGMWELVPRMRVPRFGLAAAALKGKLYVCGGAPVIGLMETLSSVECFNPGDSSWMEAPSMSTGRLGAAATTVANRLYVCGGLADAGSTHTLSSTECFDAESDSWEPLSPMSAPRCYASAATMRGCLYVCGGVADAVFTQILGSAERFDTASGFGAWETLPPLVTPRSHATLSVIGGRLYVCGGRCIQPAGSTCALSSVESLCPSANAWEAVAPMLTPRLGAATGVAAGKLFVCGGRFAAGTEALHSVEHYDPATGVWELGAPMMHPRFLPGVVAIGPGQL